MSYQPPEAATPEHAAWQQWRASGLLDAIGGAVIGTDLDGRIFYWNNAAEGLYGYSREQMVGGNVMDLFVDLRDRPDAEAIMATVRAGESWTGEFAVRIADGSMLIVQTTDWPLRWDGAVCGIIGVADMAGIAGTDAAVRRAEARVTQLARVTAELAAATSVDAVTAIVIAHAADAVGASVSSLSLLRGDDTLTLAGLRGGSSNPEEWSTYPVSANLPTSEAVRTGRPIVLVGHDVIVDRYPALVGRVGAGRSMICLPLIVGDRPLGVISLGFAQLRLPDQSEMHALAVFADTCAQAIERLNALAEAKATATKLTFLADLSLELADSLDYRVTLANIARMVVPTLADWCAVEIIEDGMLHTLAVEHADPAKIALAKEFQQRYPPDPAATTGSANVVRTGVGELYSEISDEMLVAASRDEEHLRLTRELGLNSAVVVPLSARGRTLGAITFIAAESGRRYDTTDLAFAEDLARRAATAIDNAELFTQTQQVAVMLQRAALPQQLPAVEGWEVACHYSPAGRTEVGGDFYDLIELPDHRLVAVVGDVMGRGIAAAASMAQMRAAIRAYIATDPDPVTVVHKLDAMFALYDIPQLVTLVYMLADPARDQLTIVSAGHLPPLLLSANGDCATIWAPTSPPLGVGGDRETITVGFVPGAIVLAYSDGLVERRAEDIDQGLRRLAAAAPVLHDGDLATQLDDLIIDLAHATDDDVTALAIRRRPASL